MIFYLGTDRPGWVATATWPGLFLSWVACARMRHQAVVPWALDSGGYTQVASTGGYRTSPEDYAAGVARLSTEVGRLAWAAVQDWPAAPAALAATGLTVQDHQVRTVASLLTLRTLDPTLPWVPVLTGTTPTEYLAHADLYAAAGVDLDLEATVAVGALVGHPPAHQRAVLGACATLGVPLHGLGIKGRVLGHVGHLLQSADSMGWSLYARREARPLCAPTASHRRCSHCQVWAEAWAARTVRHLEDRQPSLFDT